MYWQRLLPRPCNARCQLRLQQRIAKPAPFSTTATRLSNPPDDSKSIDSSKGNPKDDPKDNTKDSPNSKDKSKRSPLRALLPFFLSIPVGYLFHTYLDTLSATTADGFYTYTLTARSPLTPTLSLFTLHPATPSAALPLQPPSSDLPPASPGAITSIQIKQPQLQIARSYTLLPPIPTPTSTSSTQLTPLSLLIRHPTPPNAGELPTYLARLPLNSTLELRGPETEYALPANPSRVVFLAGGTGIAPALRVADALKEAEGVDVRVLWGCRERGDCMGGVGDTPQSQGWLEGLRRWAGGPGGGAGGNGEGGRGEKNAIVAHLDALKASYTRPDGSLSVEYFVDAEGTAITPSTVSALLAPSPPTHDANETPTPPSDALPLHHHQQQQQQQREEQSPHLPGRNILLISGPPGFVSHWAGPKRWINGREVQGPVGGVLGGMDTRGWEVVKL